MAALSKNAGTSTGGNNPAFSTGTQSSFHSVITIDFLQLPEDPVRTTEYENTGLWQ